MQYTNFVKLLFALFNIPWLFPTFFSISSLGSFPLPQLPPFFFIFNVLKINSRTTVHQIHISPRKEKIKFYRWNWLQLATLQLHKCIPKYIHKNTLKYFYISTWSNIITLSTTTFKRMYFLATWHLSLWHLFYFLKWKCSKKLTVLFVLELYCIDSLSSDLLFWSVCRKSALKDTVRASCDITRL